MNVQQKHIGLELELLHLGALLAVIGIGLERVIGLLVGLARGYYFAVYDPFFLSQMFLSFGAIYIALKSGYFVRFAATYGFCLFAFVSQLVFRETQISGLKDIVILSFLYTVCLFFTLVRSD